MENKISDEVRRAQLVERWENCLRVLENMSEHDRTQHWNMSLYMKTTACGTIGCAAGHCSMDPWFQEQGLKPEKSWDGYWYLPDNIDLDTFFGYRGSRDIFHNYTKRSVEDVIEEVRIHIEWLKEAPNFDDHRY